MPYAACVRLVKHLQGKQTDWEAHHDSKRFFLCESRRNIRSQQMFLTFFPMTLAVVMSCTQYCLPILDVHRLYDVISVFGQEGWQEYTISRVLLTSIRNPYKQRERPLEQRKTSPSLTSTYMYSTHTMRKSIETFETFNFWLFNYTLTQIRRYDRTPHHLFIFIGNICPTSDFYSLSTYGFRNISDDEVEHSGS